MVPSIVIVPLFVRVYGDGNDGNRYVSPDLIIRFVPALTVEFSVSAQVPGGDSIAFCNSFKKNVPARVGVGVGDVSGVVAGVGVGSDVVAGVGVGSGVVSNNDVSVNVPS